MAYNSDLKRAAWPLRQSVAFQNEKNDEQSGVKVTSLAGRGLRFTLPSIFFG